MFYDAFGSRPFSPCATGNDSALFLYPLNALMEDQKERLEELLTRAEETTGTRLTYTVYNGDLPEMEPKSTDTSDDANKLRKRIEQITGGIYEFVQTDPNEKGHFELKNAKYSHMVYTVRMCGIILRILF